jgi:hypothetical protein
MVDCKVSKWETALCCLCVSVIYEWVCNHLIISPIIRTRTRLISGIHVTIWIRPFLIYVLSSCSHITTTLLNTTEEIPKLISRLMMTPCCLRVCPTVFSFSIQSISYEMKVSNSIFPELLVYIMRSYCRLSVYPPPLPSFEVYEIILFILSSCSQIL